MSKDEWKKLNRNEWKKWIGVVGRMLLAYALVFAQGAWAAPNQGTKDKSASPQKAAAQQASEMQPSIGTSAKAQTKQAQGEESETAAAEEKPSRDGSHEGIKVHGHWTIEVRNPDGTLATHREFENSLQPAGANYLIGCLTAGCPAVLLWQLVLHNSSGSLSCNNSNSNCIINATAGVVGGALVVTGNTVSNSNSSVDTVDSVINSSTFVNFTHAVASTNNQNFSTPIPVSAGQTIAVTVNISFS